MVSLILCVLFFLPLVLLTVARWKRWARVAHQIEKLPGPKAYPIIGNSPTFFNASRDEHFNIDIDVAKRYGPVYRIWIGWIPVVHIIQPNDMEVVLRGSQHLERSFFYSLMHPWLGTGLLTSSGAKWHSHRKMITPAFHFKILDSFLQVFNENAELLVKLLGKELNSESFNVQHYIWACALDIICETAMGTKVYAQTSITSEYVNALYRQIELLSLRYSRPWFYFDWIFNLSHTGREYAKYLKILLDFTNKVVKERKEIYMHQRQSEKQNSRKEELDVGSKTSKAFLDLLIEASTDGAKLTDQELREEVETFMFEGHETTATALGWVLFNLGSHPEIQDKVFEEVNGVFGDSSRPATMRDLHNMHYLDRCIKETIRLYPSVPHIGRVTTEDCKLGGYIIPKGTEVTLRFYDTHRNPDIFPNPEEFNPDNFLPERAKGRHPYAYVPFSAGPRNCIGQKFAMLEMKTVISTLIRHYKITALDKKEDIVRIIEMVLRPLHGINLKIEPRIKSK